jgi:type IV secretion system protein TrbE
VDYRAAGSDLRSALPGHRPRYGQSRTELDRLVGEFTGVFTNADGNLFAETYNQLNAYFATVPGNYALNLRQLYLLNTNYADLSFLFTILPGEKTAPRHGVPGCA